MKVTETAGGVVYTFRSWSEFIKAYPRLFNANSGPVIRLPRYTAG